MLLILIIGQIISFIESDDVLITNLPHIEHGHESREIVNMQYNHIISYYCRLYGIDPELVRLIIEKESNFNPNAVSKSGAVGLMQLMPETGKWLGVKDLYNPWENVNGGVKYLRKLYDMFDGDLELVLAAYHAGPNLVKRLNRVPAIPTTVAYVNYIISRYGPARKKISIYFTLTYDGTPFFTNVPK